MKIKRTQKWHKKITLKELQHIHETTWTGTLEQLKRNLDHHREQDAKSEAEVPEGAYWVRSCRECLSIARKLGL